MRAKSVLLLMLALGCGLVASIGITQVMAKRGSPSLPSGETEAIFVAVQDIPMGDPITPEALKLEEWPKDKIPPGALTKTEQLEGRRPKSTIVAGMPIVESQLLDSDWSGAPKLIPKGMRVVSVRVTDESGISNLIRPRDRVDVLLYMRREPGVIMETATRTILQDIQVFAVNDVFLMDDTDAESSINAKTVSLLVTPSQAEIVTLATALGDIRLALRSLEDKEVVESTGAFPHELDHSEGSNRDKETLAKASPAESGPSELDGFLGLLNSQGSQASAVAEKPEETNSWTMRVIRGPEISEVVLQMANDSAAAGADANESGFSSWKTISPPRDTGSAAAAVDPEQDQSAADAGEKETDEADQTDEADETDQTDETDEPDEPNQKHGSED